MNRTKSKTNFNSFPNAIIRERNYGKSNLIYKVDKKAALTDPNIKVEAYTNTVVDLGKSKRPKKTKVSRFQANVVANNLFKASHPVTYQGLKEGSVNNRLPLSFIPAEIKKYDVDAGGSAYNEGSGEVAEQENRDMKKPPKLNTQWQARGRIIATKDRPNPFPIEVNPAVKIR